MVFLVSSVRQFAPGTLLIVVVTPIWARLSCTRTAIGSLTPAKPRSNEIGTLMLLTPASARSFLALSRSVLNLCGCGQATSIGASAGAPNIGLARPYNTASMIFWYGIAQATAYRTLTLSKGGCCTFIPMY